MAQATEPAFVNPFNRTDRPPLWMVTYDLNFSTFSKLGPREQYEAELADAVNGVELLLERKWKAAYTSFPDFSKGYIFLKVGSQAEAEQLIKGYRMYQYFENLKFNKVYSATQAGFNLKILWAGIRKYLRLHKLVSGVLVVILLVIMVLIGLWLVGSFARA
jgi:hypothetical protein